MEIFTGGGNSLQHPIVGRNLLLLEAAMSIRYGGSIKRFLNVLQNNKLK